MENRLAIDLSSAAVYGRNWEMAWLYARKQFTRCVAAADAVVGDTGNMSEYASYMKGTVLRYQGDATKSLSLFQHGTRLAPSHSLCLKQVGRSLFLSGRHRQALEVYERATKVSKDWETFYYMGLCYAHLGQTEAALANFRKSNSIERHDLRQRKFGEAIELLEEALDFSPENPQILAQLGLLCLRRGDSPRAFDYLGTAVGIHRQPRTVLALSSIIQDHGDLTVALEKYKSVATAVPTSAQLWNNVGMCFFGKNDFVSAVSCLRRALYLAPFEWIIIYNLGLVYLGNHQYASAFHHLSAAINVKPDYCPAYHYLAVALAHLGDAVNCMAAYQRALKMASKGEQPLIMLNAAASAMTLEQPQQAAGFLRKYERMVSGGENSHPREQASQMRFLATQISDRLGSR